MHANYNDIVSRLGRPLWWDANAVPRYDDFIPELSANIYANEVALVEIECQWCRKRMMVEMNWSPMDMQWGTAELIPRMSERVETLHYGDPPRHECPGGGETMNCIDIRVFQFWTKHDNLWEWVRNTGLEIELPQ